MRITSALVVSLFVLSFPGLVNAQFGPGGSMPGLGQGTKLTKLFGENNAFSANLDIQTVGGPGAKGTIPGKIAFDAGKARFELDMGQMKDGNMPPETGAQMKAMGMDKMVMISRPDRNANIIVYPGLKAYIESPLDPAQTNDPSADFKLETEQLGRETIGGYDTIRNRVQLTDRDGKKYEATVWNAVDLKKFPVRILQRDRENTVTLTFKDITLSSPDAKQFDVPAGFTKYTDMPSLMQQAMMKQFGGDASPPGGTPPARDK